MDKHQAETVANTLLAPAREAQDQKAQHRLEQKQRAESQRLRGAFAVTGFIGGALIGHFVIGDAWTSALVGLVLGSLVWFLRSTNA